MDGVNKNNIERLFSQTIAFRIRLKGLQFYGKLALLISDQDSVKNNFFYDCKEEKYNGRAYW